MTKYTFTDGCMWDGGPWIIDTDVIITGEGDKKPPCKHCHTPHKEFTRYHWTCPYVVVADNEGGYNSTGVCLECILEAAASIGVRQQAEDK